MEKIPMGSGKLYIDEFTGTLPEDSVIEVEEKLLGYITNGASVSYKPKFYEAKDDLGIVSRKVITEEEVIMKSGLITWNGKTLQKLSSTARVTEDAEKKIRTVKIGGIGNYDNKKYVIHFVSADAGTGNIRFTIVGSNEAGFEINFSTNKESAVNVEFKAQPHDDEGTLVIMTQKDESITA